MASILLTRQWLMEGQKDPDTTKLQTRIPTPWPFCLSAKRFTTMPLRRASDIKLQLTHKGENLKKKTKVKEIQQEHFIDSRKWITITCLSGDSNPNYPCLSITPCRGRPPVILPVCCSVSHCCCNISAGMPRIASWILCLIHPLFWVWFFGLVLPTEHCHWFLFFVSPCTFNNKYGSIPKKR